MVVRNHCLSILLAIAVAASLLISSASAVDTDGDGLLDLIDVPGFDPNASGVAWFDNRRIQDLDGASLLTNLTWLSLYGNQITSIESGDFQGLANLQSLDLGVNQITSIESGAFDGLGNLEKLWLSRNQITSLESGAFEGLSSLQWLDLDGTALSLGAFNQMFSEITSVRAVNLADLTFTDEYPNDFSTLLSIESLDDVYVDIILFERYADEFNAFDAIARNTVTVVPEPSAVFPMFSTILGLVAISRSQPRPQSRARS